mmetsp:Transcript_10841/g.17551  ORF Transcript_10841/g.17551 Transcript_10841/m.17551 type:complete len:83 (+) Transcript_10841:1555-1803(+)
METSLQIQRNLKNKEKQGRLAPRSTWTSRAAGALRSRGLAYPAKSRPKANSLTFIDVATNIWESELQKIPDAVLVNKIPKNL